MMTSRGAREARDEGREMKGERREARGTPIEKRARERERTRAQAGDVAKGVPLML